MKMLTSLDTHPIRAASPSTHPVPPLKMLHNQRIAAENHLNSSNTIEFQTLAHTEEGFRVCSPPLWRSSSLRGRKNDQYSSPLLPHNHLYSNISSTSRSQAIAESRKELMEMVQNMPESCFELSLKDMVEKQHILQEVHEEAVVEDESSHFDIGAEIKKYNKKESNRPSQISRNRSMDNEGFLIKIFFPSSIGLKKKATVRDSSKVSPRPSFEESGNHMNKERWIKRLFAAKEAENGGKDNTGSSSSRSSSKSSSSRSSSSSKSRRSNSNTSREVNRSFFPSCWAFFWTKNSKTMRDEGCIC